MKKFITIQQLDGSEQQLTETNLPIIIGTDDKSHIKLTSGKPLTAFIGEEQGHLFIQPSDTTEVPLFHNDRQLTDSSWLKSNDTVKFQDTIINCLISGDIITFVVTELSSRTSHHPLQPPTEPPPGNIKTENGIDIPVTIADEKRFSTKNKIIAGLFSFTFLFLGLAVVFILLAEPLKLNISPEPDSISIAGFPPAVKFGTDYLCIPGTYSINIKKQGYNPFTESLAIDRKGNNIFSAALTKLPGTLHLDITPPDGVKLFSGTDLIGTTPPDLFKISAGKHAIRLKKERYQPYNIEILIEGENKKQIIKAELKPDWAEITFNSIPQQASVFVDGKLLGQTPFSAQLLSGDKKISVTKKLYSEHKTTFTVQAGAPSTHSFTMHMLPGQLSLTTNPDQAAVTVDNKYLGSTPITFSLSSNSEHEITLHAPGFKSSTRKINLGPGELKEIDFNLEQEHGIIYLATHPPDASVSINGKQFSSSQGKLVLPAKKQKLKVSASGYKSVTRTLRPKAGISQQITIDLSPETAAAITYSAPETKQNVVTTTAGQKMIRVQPSTFSMGAPRREPGRRANERERTVIMKRPFYLSEKPVTNRDYRLFKKDHSSGKFGNHTLNGNKQPVVNISWEETVQYLNWLSLKENLQPFYIVQGDSFTATSPPTNGFRLPTEAEWAFSARSTENTENLRFPWGSIFPPHIVSGNFADESAREILPQILHNYNDSFPVSSPVGSFKPNSGGFYDMGGNIGEWCHDFYSAYTSTLSNKADPLGPVSGLHHVVRGSSWRDATIKELRLSYRAYSRKKMNTIGFRIARYQ